MKKNQQTNSFAAFAQRFEKSLGLDKGKTSQFIESLSKNISPSLSNLEEKIEEQRKKLNLSLFKEPFNKYYQELIKENNLSLEEISKLYATFQETIGRKYRAEDLLEIAFEVIQKSFFEKNWDSPVDEFGMDPEIVEAVKPLFQFLYQDYWRIDSHGIKNVPDKGRALLISNHSGTLPYDGSMLDVAMMGEHPKKRAVRFLVEDFVYHFPFIGTLIHRFGGVRACPENATWLLNKGEIVSVFPEGVKGLGKLYKDRYKLQRFGRGGFIRLAIKTRSPIIPVAIIGAEEIHPIIWKSNILARSMGVPYLPVTPTFPWLGMAGAIPFPSKWDIYFEKPISFEKYEPKDAENNLLVHKLSEQVRKTIQEMIDENLKKRKSIWFG